MLENLQKFNSLPESLKNKVSAPEVLEAIEDLENRYGLSLANLVIRVMIKDFSFSELSQILISEFKLDEIKAATLEAELRGMVFKEVLDYLSPENNYSPEDVETKIEETITVDKKEEEQEKKETKIENLPAIIAQPSHSLIEKPKDDASNFLKEDEKEIADFHKQVSDLPPKVVDLNLAVEEIMRDSDMVFASSELAGRLRSIILTYLKNIRTKAEAREGLIKSVLSGGLSLEEVEADRVLAVAQKKKDEGGVPLPVDTKKIFAVNEKEVENITEKNKISPVMVEYDLAAELKKKTASSVVVEKEEKVVTPLSVSEEKIEPIPLSDVSENKEIARKVTPFGNKKKMDDIGVPQVMSPIDELAYMDLVVFRRLGDDAQKIINKIKSVIDLLAKEGIDKQIEGVGAWRRSPVNRTYLSMGQESIMEEKDIDAVIVSRKEKNLNYLTREEFEAIMDLNNRLRF